MANKDVLNIGCGQDKMADAVNIDFNSSVNPDVVHDLNQSPYPFKASQFNRIYCYHVLEHLDDVFKVMDELHRISKKGGRIIIRSPHFSHADAYRDPSHKHYFSVSSFEYFSNTDSWAFYTKNKFRIVSKRIVFQQGLLRVLLGRIFNRCQNIYETRFAWIFPAKYFEVVLEPVK